MAGPGVALRLHEFRESQDSGGAEAAETLRRRTSRPGRDVHGLYPGQLGRVHTVHSKDCGGKSQSLHHESLNQQQHENPNHPLSFDVQTLRALTVLHDHGPHVLGRRRPQTTYQDEFGLQAPLCPQ